MKRPSGSMARERTQGHLRRLLAAAASGAVVGACSGGSTNVDPSGYGVVDPMPEPSRCTGTAPRFQAKASWKTVGTVRLIEVVLTAPSGDADIKLTATATAATGAVMDQKTEGLMTTILVDPRGGSNISANLPITCAKGAAQLSITVQADPKDPTALQAVLNDTW